MRHMDTQLISMKISIPPSRVNLVQQEQLVEWLAEAEQMKLTVVSAPPGFGKTRLLNEWAATTKFPLAWLSLDNRDNDQR